MDLVGIEPTTSSMPWKRAPSCATGPLEGRNHVNNAIHVFSLTAAPESNQPRSVGAQRTPRDRAPVASCERCCQHPTPISRRSSAKRKRRREAPFLERIKQDRQKVNMSRSSMLAPGAALRAFRLGRPQFH